MKTNNKEKKFDKKYVILIGIILVAILSSVLFWFFNKDKDSSNVLDFLNYDIPYDGEAKIGDYKNYTIKMDDILQEGYDNYIKTLIKDYEDFGDPIEGAVVKEDSCILISLSLYNGDKLLRTSDYTRLDLSQISFTKEITDELKKQLVGKTSGATFEFTFKGTDNLALLEEERKLDITYKGYLINVLDGYKYPELTDEWVRESTIYNSISDLEKNIKIDLLFDMYYDKEVYYEAVRSHLKYLIEEDAEIIKNATPLVNLSNEEIRDNIKLMANAAGMTPEAYLHNGFGMTEEEYYEFYSYNYSCAETITIEIALLEKLNVSDEAYNQYLLEIAKDAGLETVEELLKDYSLYYDERVSKQDFVKEVVLNHIIDNYLTIIESEYQDIVNEMLDYYEKDEYTYEIETSLET